MLTASRELADYFEDRGRGAGGDAKLAANWVMGELAGRSTRKAWTSPTARSAPAQLGGLLQRISDNTISGKIAKQVFEAMWNGEGDADSIIEARA